jgi:hypothetical protein
LFYHAPQAQMKTARSFNCGNQTPFQSAPAGRLNQLISHLGDGFMLHAGCLDFLKKLELDEEERGLWK